MDCLPIAYAKCSENNTCVCQFDSYEYNNTICLAKNILLPLKSELSIYYHKTTDRKYRLNDDFPSHSGLRRESNTKWGDRCTMCSDIEFDGLICDDATQEDLRDDFEFQECRCPRGTKLNSSSLSCDEPEFNDCSIDGDCSHLSYASCSGGKCSCLQNYHSINGRCLGNLGAKCSHDIDCRILYAVCKSSSCQCDYDYYEKDGSCIKYATEIEGYCRTNKSCELLDHTSCSRNKCRCLPSYENVNGSCRKHSQREHNTDPELAVRKHTCQVDYYYEKYYCRAYAKRLNDECFSEKACERLNLTSCLHGRCNCSKFNIICKVLNAWSYFV
ncbi:rh5-interacting protein-like isoform X2 [Microplitis mediator]|nr:rh5-interacting protein-like isoform X2 [Microplitis mediator]XP_057335921.1 rh5-interacting protein-like isoform X2 [Microplitis mediator]